MPICLTHASASHLSDLLLKCNEAGDHFLHGTHDVQERLARQLILMMTLALLVASTLQT